MGAVEALYSSCARQLSPDPKSPNYIIATYTRGSACPENSYQTETRDSPPTSAKHSQKNSASHGTCQQPITPKLMASQSKRTNRLSSISALSQPIRKTGQQHYQLQH